MLDILSSGSGVAAWLGSTVLYILFRAQGDGEWSALRQLFFWVAISWTVSMIVETLHFSSNELSLYLPWFSYFIDSDYQVIRKVTTWPIQAWAYWHFIMYLLRPKAMPAVAVIEAQVTIDVMGIIIDWNTAARNLLGWTAEEAINQEMASLIVPEDLLIDGQPARDFHRLWLAHYRATGEAPIAGTRFPTFAICKNLKQIAVDLRVTKSESLRETTFVGQLSPRSMLPTTVPPT